ncbi:MAG: glycoside-pentoside-hexuronide (GPH):cation symporter [Candidatus Promineifilaceae bacterium]|nr:glycoside-pentoside-hexuronide (GPH):cation symporter [Candidatus Promineifilaceae bacterium]
MSAGLADQMMPAQPLSRRTKFIYGLGDWGTAGATSARNLYWLFFLVSVVGLHAELAGTVILVGRGWDAINDPLVGTISDRLQTRWGRRRPLLLFGALPFALFFTLLFVVPPFEDDWLLSIYYGAVFLAFDTAYTIVNVPYAALTAELSEDYDERSSLAGWRVATAMLASLAASATFKLLAEQVFASALVAEFGPTTALRFGYAASAALWGITFAIPPLILFKTLREPRRTPVVNSPLRPWQTFREVFNNRPFRIGATVYLISFATADVVVTVLIWFLVFYVRVEPGFDSTVLGVSLGLAFLSMPLTVRLMRRLGKRNTYILAMGVFAIVLLILSQAPPGNQLYILAAATVAGFGFGAVNVIPWAMVADVVEADELKTGQRREGIYAGYLVFFRKLAATLAVFLVTRILALTGFQEGTTGGLFVEQPASALLALRLLVGVVPAAMLALAIAVAWRYPLNREMHQAIRRELAEKRARRQLERTT